MKCERRLLPNERSFSGVNTYKLHPSICDPIDKALSLYLKGPQLHPTRLGVDVERRYTSNSENAGAFAEQDFDFSINHRRCF